VRSIIVYIALLISFSAPPAFLTLQDLTSTFDKYPIPSPTLLFVKPQHLEQLAGAINNQAGASSLWSLARRHKRSALASGFVSKDGLWDRLVLDTARAEVMRTGAGTVRGIIIGGAPLSAESLVPARIALSVPLVHVHAHPAVAGPVTASHALDVQVFPVGSGEFKDVAHAGPPAINVEAKLVGVDDDSVEKGEDPAGELLVRGPSVARVEVVGEEQDVSASSLAADGEQEWLKTEERARVMTNGCFQIVEARSK
jgi:long-chain acyl-CoA synthetase